MKHLLSSFCVIALFGLPLIAQEEPIRIEVDAVNVLVTVTDKSGRFVTDLPRDRFKLFDNGELRELTNFSHETELPLRIGLLIDTSASVRPKLDFEKTAATQFIRSIMKPQDETLLAEFDSGLSMVSDFTDKSAEIARRIRGLRAGGGTALLDALYEVVAKKMVQPGVRKTVILISDGEDLDSKRTLDEVLRRIQQAGVVVYGIGTNRFGAGGEKKGERALERLAEGSGGRAFFPYSEQQFTQAFEQIEEELRSQYSLTFVPRAAASSEEELRQIKVKIVDGKKLKLRYRKGYTASRTS